MTASDPEPSCACSSCEHLAESLDRLVLARREVRLAARVVDHAHRLDRLAARLDDDDVGLDWSRPRRVPAIVADAPAIDDAEPEPIA